MENLVQIWHNTKIPCYFSMSADWRPGNHTEDIIPIKMVTKINARRICSTFNFKNAPDSYLENKSK